MKKKTSHILGINVPILSMVDDGTGLECGICYEAWLLERGRALFVIKAFPND